MEFEGNAKSVIDNLNFEAMGRKEIHMALRDAA